MLDPVYLAQQTIETKFAEVVRDTIGGINGRLIQVEEDVYNKESRSDRLSKLEQRISDCEL
jgi:hypothetical protein